MTEALAKAWEMKQLNVDHLLKAHELCGSGFFLPAAVSAVVCLMATVALDDFAVKVQRPLVAPGYLLVGIPQTGRCFVTALYVFTNATKFPKLLDIWRRAVRSDTSMPLNLHTGEVNLRRLKEEEACSLARLIAHPKMAHDRLFQITYIQSRKYKFQ